MKGRGGGGGKGKCGKEAMGYVVGALGVVAGAEVSDAAMTGSADATNWGQQVRLQGIACKAALETGEHGIGSCVSAFASQHGQLMSGHASGARLNHGNANANGHGKASGEADGKAKGNGKANGHGHGQTSHKPDHAVVVSHGAGG